MDKIGWKIKLSIWVIAFIALFFVGKNIIHEYSQTNKGEVSIHSGANLQQITMLLEKYDIVKNGDAFYYYMRMKSFMHKRETGQELEFNFKHGKYYLNKSDFKGLIVQLEEGPDKEGPNFSVTIPEGYTILKMAEVFDEEKIFTKDQFLAYVQSPKVYEEFRKKYMWLPPYNQNKLYQLEGYLKADTYYLGTNPSIENIVSKMLEETNGWYKRNHELIEGMGYTFDQILTIASMVEAESKFEEDRAKVAQVFYNRLKIGMKLQSDMTAAYANQEHKIIMTHEDISVKSPYNTYYVKALPLGPIGSPSQSSMVGTLTPAGKEFKNLYFYARPSGETLYAETPEEHQTNIDKYRHEWEKLNKKN